MPVVSYSLSTTKDNLETCTKVMESSIKVRNCIKNKAKWLLKAPLDGETAKRVKVGFGNEISKHLQVIDENNLVEMIEIFCSKKLAGKNDSGTSNPGIFHLCNLCFRLTVPSLSICINFMIFWILTQTNVAENYWIKSINNSKNQIGRTLFPKIFTFSHFLHCDKYMHSTFAESNDL